MKPAIQFILILSFILILNAVSLSAQSKTTSNTPSFSITFTGEEEAVEFSSQIPYTPDANISFIKKVGGDIHLWLQGLIIGQVNGQSTYFFKGSNFESLLPHQTDNGKPIPVFTPSGSGFDRDYAGSSAVMRAKNGVDLLMFYHAEDYTCGRENPKVGIGLALSSDDGITWNRLGQVISSSALPSDCNYTGFRGVGNPTVLISGDGQYIYMYYTEWLPSQTDSIHLARALVSSDGVPGSWFKYKYPFFDEPGLGGVSKPVIEPASVSAGYAGVPSVTFNSYLNLYLAIFMGHDGFYYTSSTDGIFWNTSKIFWAKPALTAWDSIDDGDNWYYYPSLISIDQNTDDITTQNAYLYYARGTKNGPPHSMFRRLVRIGYEISLPMIIKGLKYCTGNDWQEPCLVSSDRFVVGDIVIDGISQYDSRTNEGTVAFSEKESTVYAQWGAGYFSGNIDMAGQFIQSEFAKGCIVGCSKVRFVNVRFSGQQDVLCYYPDGTVRELQRTVEETWCP